MHSAMQMSMYMDMLSLTFPLFWSQSAGQQPTATIEASRPSTINGTAADAGAPSAADLQKALDALDNPDAPSSSKPPRRSGNGDLYGMLRTPRMAGVR